MRHIVYACCVILTLLGAVALGLHWFDDASDLRRKRLKSTVYVMILVAWAIMSWASVARGQSLSDTLLRQAYELRRAGHDEEALPLLEQAYAADRSPRVAAQLGLCDQALGQWTPAQEHLREALAAPADSWVSRHLAALEGAYTLVSSHAPAPTPAQPERSLNRAVPIANPAFRVDSGSRAGRRAIRPIVRPGPPVPAITMFSLAGTLELGGISALIARQAGIDAYNARVAQGLPCDRAAAVTARDAETGLAIAGIGAGAVALVVGGVMMAMQPHPRGLAWACAPGVGGASCAVRF